MTGVNSLFAQMATANTSTSSSGSTGTGSGNSSTQQTSNDELNANSFITLLTTQLQAQDPLNPMDPDQMVSELTEMNTLQEIIQMRTDLDTLVGDTQGSTSTTGGTTGS